MVAAKFDFAAMTPQQRRDHIQEYHSAHLVDPAAKPSYQLEGEGMSGWFEEWRLLGKLRTPDQIIEVLRVKEWKSEISALAPGVQKSLCDYLDRRYLSTKEHPFLHTATRVVVYTDGLRNPMGERVVLPDIFLGIEDDTDGSRTGSLPISGSQLESGVADYLKSLWVRPPDTLHSPLEATPLPAKFPSPPNILFNSFSSGNPFAVRKAWTDYWTDLIQNFQMPVCLIVSDVAGMSRRQSPAQTLGELINPTHQQVQGTLPFVKWRDGVLLGTYLLWFRDAESFPSARIMSQVDRMEKNHRVTALELALLCSTIEEEPWNFLLSRKPFLTALERVRPLLKVAWVRSDLARPNGIPITEELAEVLPPAVLSASKQGATSVRIITLRTQIHSENKPCFALQLQILTPKRNWIAIDAWKLFDL